LQVNYGKSGPDSHASKRQRPTDDARVPFVAHAARQQHDPFIVGPFEKGRSRAIFAAQQFNQAPPGGWTAIISFSVAALAADFYGNEYE
jgi:hypothetical protein